jgi:hypothetical protein
MRRGTKHKPETIEKIRKSMEGKKWSEERRRRFGQVRKGLKYNKKKK